MNHFFSKAIIGAVLSARLNANYSSKNPDAQIVHRFRNPIIQNEYDRQRETNLRRRFYPECLSELIYPMSPIPPDCLAHLLFNFLILLYVRLFCLHIGEL